MSMLRSLAWPHLVPAKPSETPLPTSTPSSVREIVDQIENQKTHTRRSSHGDQPRTPPYRTLPARPELHARASDPYLPITPSPIISSRISSPTYIKPETILRRYVVLPVQIEEGNHRIGSDISQSRSPSRMKMALDSETDHAMPPYLSDSPYMNALETQSFEDPFAGDLLQFMSDSPIGGKMSAPNRGSEEYKSRSQPLNSPRVEVPSSSRRDSNDESSRSESSARAGLLDPSGNLVSAPSTISGSWSKTPDEALAVSRARGPKQQKSLYARTNSPRIVVVSQPSHERLTSQMSDSRALLDSSSDYFGSSVLDLPKSSLGSMTTQQSPLPPMAKAEQSDFSYDGPGYPNSLRSSVRDFAQPQSTPPYLEVMRTDRVPALGPNISTDSFLVPASDDHPKDELSLDGIGATCCDPPADLTSPLPKTPNGFTDAPNGFTDVPNGFDTPSSKSPPEMAGALPAPPGLACAPISEILGIPGVPMPDVAVPTRTLRELPQKKKVPVIKKVLRNGRRVVLRTPVLAVVLGRQLAKPTAIALKQISKGLPIEAVADAAGGLPVPILAPISV